jgi:hypothetical protein
MAGWCWDQPVVRPVRSKQQDVSPQPPSYEFEHGQNAGLRALNLDVTEALAIARQVEDDVAQLLHAFSS